MSNLYEGLSSSMLTMDRAHLSCYSASAFVETSSDCVKGRRGVWSMSNHDIRVVHRSSLNAFDSVESEAMAKRWPVSKQVRKSCRLIQQASHLKRKCPQQTCSELW